jgi:hypothetical protein
VARNAGILKTPWEPATASGKKRADDSIENYKS